MVTTNINSKSIDFNPFELGKEIEKIILINESQREIWLSCIIGQDAASLAYNETLSLKFNGKLSIYNLKKSFYEVVQRHEALRSTISPDGGHLVIYKSLDFDFNFESLIGLSNNEKVEAMKTFVEIQMSTPIDLHDGPLFRVYVHQTNETEHYFTLVIHHIICDGWSKGVILENLSKFYNAQNIESNPVLPPLVQISDYAVKQYQFSQSNEFKETERFWTSLYKSDIPLVDLPTDFNRKTTRTYNAARIDHVLTASLVKKLKETGGKAGCSLVNTMLSLFEIFLSNYTKQSDIVIGLPAAGQLATDNYELVGHCVNVLPIKSKIDHSQSFVDYLKQSKSSFLDAYDHQLFSFGQILKKLNFKRDNSRVPLIPIVLNIDSEMNRGISFDDLSFDLMSTPRAYETFEIFLNLTGSNDTLILEWTYNTDLFKESTINKMFAEFKEILCTFVENPNAMIVQSGENIEADKQRAMSVGNIVVNKQTFLDLFKLNSARYAQKNAVSFLDETISYEEIYNQSDSLATFLIDQGVQKGDIVAIATERSIKMLIGLLAIMKAGAAYLPLDPEYPKDRIEFMLEDSGAKTLLLSKKYQNSYQTNAEYLIIEDIWPLLKKKSPQIVNVSENDLAYILYTSGSTGKPKGVKITHQNLANFLTSMKLTPGICASDSLLAITTISFDIAGLELFLPLIAGAELVIADSESTKDGRLLFDILLQRPITVMQATPSTWQMILDSGWTNPLPIKILSGGEAMSKDLAEKLTKVSRELWNMYGPTETTIWSTIKQILPDDEILTIGNAIQNTEVYILNEQNKPLAINEVGEICIGGDGVAKGYLNRAELTAEKFISHFEQDKSERKLYKTGDLGKILPNGEVFCLGRIDQQVKIRGHRIELGEIEAIIAQHKDVKQSVVSTFELNPGDKRLVAYVLLSEDADNVKFDTIEETDTNAEVKMVSKESTSFWKKNLSDQLPNYMVPDYYISLTSFPLTPNSKIDRKALPIPIIKKISNSATQILTDNEKLVAEIWTDLLCMPDLKATDDFFELGGHSLLAINVMVAIEKRTGIRLPLTVLFDHSTIGSLATQLQNNETENNWKSLIPIKKDGTMPPLYIVHGQGMNIIGFRTLAPELGDDQPIYGLQAKGLNPNDEPLDDVEMIAAEYIKEMLQSNPHGPYALMGYSSGGLIALEMSVQLKKIGKEISFLALLDTYAEVNDLKALLNEKKYLEIFGYMINRAKHLFSYFAKSPMTRIKTFTRNRFYFIYNIFKKVQVDENNPLFILEKLEKAHERAFKKYNFKKYDIPVHLFKANDLSGKHIRYAETNGLEPFIEAKIKVINVPYGHLQFFKLPHVKTFAAELKKALYLAMITFHVIPI